MAKKQTPNRRVRWIAWHHAQMAVGAEKILRCPWRPTQVSLEKLSSSLMRVHLWDHVGGATILEIPKG